MNWVNLLEAFIILGLSGVAVYWFRQWQDLQNQHQFLQRELNLKTELLTLFIWASSHEFSNLNRTLNLWLTSASELTIFPQLLFQVSRSRLKRSEKTMANLIQLGELMNHCRWVTVSLESLIQSVVSQFPEADIQWSRFPKITCLAGLLQLFFYHLLSNSCQYCSTRPSIRLQWIAQSPCIRIQYQDNSRGLSEEQFQRLGEYGLRLTAESGVGLGLVIAHQILKLHQGSWKRVPQTPGFHLQIDFPSRPDWF